MSQKVQVLKKKKEVQVRVRPVSLEMGDEWAPIQWLRSRKEGGWGFESRTQSMKQGTWEEE